MIPDPIKFAIEERSLEGRVAQDELARLADVLAETRGDVEWKLAGSRATDGKLILRLEVKARLVFGCQRCLSALELDFDKVSVLRLVRPGTPIGDEELEIDEFDTIEASQGMDVIALVEDEMLLALPIAPRHERCEPPRPAGGTERKSPFDVLAGLRGSDKVQ